MLELDFKKMYYLFDIDGTITPARQKMTPDFRNYFLKWMTDKKVIFVTGSDYLKIQEQVCDEILNKAERVYCCMGNSCWKNGVEIFRNNWALETELEDFLHSKIKNSKYPLRLGNHIEKRIGMLNFSIVGRNANKDDRKKYFEWDNANKERKQIQLELKNKFPKIDCQIGGEISMDIIPFGHDKTQVLNYIDDNVYFFADKMFNGGNDETLAKALSEKINNKIFPVKIPEETMKILIELSNNTKLL